MKSIINFFESEFNTQRDQWEKGLMSELKLTELGSRDNKKQLSGMKWPILSLTGEKCHLGVSESWKKASNTYGHIDLLEVESVLTEDLQMGVRNFYFHAEALSLDKWNLIESILKKFPKKEELEIFILDAKEGHLHFQSQSLKVYSQFISGQLAHDYGGHSIQELALLATELIHHLASSNSKTLHVGIYLDSQFFHNISKVRAAKLLVLKILQASKREMDVRYIGLTSYRDWTLFERYSNMLRNEVAVASGYIAGADYVQSAGYNTILELESKNISLEDHIERSRRMARNTSHILALESMLGVVEDAAFGSYHLESLTQSLAEESWKLMQTLVELPPSELKIKIEKETSIIREKRLDLIKTRRHVVSGVNDFPDVKETLKLDLRETTLFRGARIFEELRLRMTASINKPSVFIALYGEYGALNARLNFVKNYFELLGLVVSDSGKSILDLETFKKETFARKEDIIVLCALDDSYTEVASIASQFSQKEKFIAGKVEMMGFKNLYAGQNVYDVLHDLVERHMQGSKS